MKRDDETGGVYLEILGKQFTEKEEQKEGIVTNETLRNALEGIISV